jgi:predicted dehydrogenase
MSISRRKFIKTAALASAGATILPRHVLGNGHIPPSDRINIGFIGLGRQSRGLARDLINHGGAQIVAGSDVWNTKRSWFKEHVASSYAEFLGTTTYHGITAYPDYRELLQQPDIDAVVVATPDHWHALQSIDAMKSGKDLYCEKPLTRTIPEGRRLTDTARDTGRVVQTGSMQRSRSNFRRACELVRNGYLGEIRRVEVNVGDPARAYDLPEEKLPDGIDWKAWCGPAPLLPYNHRLAPASNNVKFWPDWRLFRETGGGILADWGAHMFDIAQWGLGMDRSGPVEFIPPQDPTAVRGLEMKYANGVELAHADFGRGWAVRFIGSEGKIDISRKFFESDSAGLADIEFKEGDVRLMDTGGDHLGNWLDAIRSRGPTICDAETGHRSASVCSLANIAYRLNRPLEWDPASERFKYDEEANRLAAE